VSFCTSPGPQFNGPNLEFHRRKKRFLKPKKSGKGDSYCLRTFQHTPGTYPWNPEPTVYGSEFLEFGRVGEAWGMLQGYVGVLLDTVDGRNTKQPPFP